MFNFADFTKLKPKVLYQKEVFLSSPLSPVIIEWWNPHPVYCLHKHMDFKEFAIMRHGVSLHYHRGKFQLLAPGDATFIGTQNPHAYVCTHEVGLFNVVFNAEYFYHNFPEVKNLLNKLKAVSPYDSCLKISPKSLKQTLSIVHRIEYERSSKFDDITSASMFSLFLQITIMLLRDNNPEYMASQNLSNGDKIELRLQTLITTVEHIRKLAYHKIKDITFFLDQNNLNTKTIQRYFQKYMRISLYQFILLQKLTCTMNYIIQNPDAGLDDIIDEMGYTNYRSFARNVNHFFSVSPKNFKRIILAIVLE